jgi:hypothetical protein
MNRSQSNRMYIMNPVSTGRSKTSEDIDNLKNNLIQTLTDYFYKKTDKETAKNKIFDIETEFNTLKNKIK